MFALWFSAYLPNITKAPTFTSGTHSRCDRVSDQEWVVRAPVRPASKQV